MKLTNFFKYQKFPYKYKYSNNSIPQVKPIPPPNNRSSII